MRRITPFTNTKILLVAFLCFGMSNAVLAQSIIGKITDSETNEAIEGVHIFVSGTTGGAVTNIGGKYIFDTKGRKDFKLVFSHISYEVQVFNFSEVDKDSRFDLKLVPKVTEITTVEVVAKNDKKRDKRLEEFKTFFFGKGYDKSLIEIENEYALEFKSTGLAGFKVEGEPVLEIYNRYLGYKIYFHLIDFNSGKESFLGYGDFSPIEDLADTAGMNYLDNRVLAYKGSLRHFFKTITDGVYTPGDNGFNVQMLKRTRNDRMAANKKFMLREPLIMMSKKIKTGNFYFNPLEGGEYGIFFEDLMEITYQNEADSNTDLEVSEVYLKEVIRINDEGIVLNPEAIQVKGHLLNEGVYFFLPYNYLPKR